MKEDSIIDKLIQLTLDKQYNEIKNVLQLNGYSTKFKGDIFELYIKELYEGNGWICRRVGGKNDRGADLLLSHPEEPDKVIHIIQAKNHLKPLGFKETRSELIQFEEITSIEYNCYDYRIISLNGYSQSTSDIDRLEKLKQFNISLYDFNDLKYLIDNYNIDRFNIKPALSLYAHNEAAYKNVLNDWEEYSSTSVVQATGTGKSKVLLKLAGEFFYNEEKLILAPSNYILDQLKKDKDNWALNNTTYMTYSKLSRMPDEEIRKIKAKLVCFDEFHRCGARVWSKKVKVLIDHIEQNQDSRILGLTATPIRSTADKRNMADELFNGRISNHISVQEAIVKNILPMPIYVSALYTIEDEIKTLLERVRNSDKTPIEKKKIENQLKNIAVNWEKTHGIVDIIKKYISFKEGKGIIFCENINHLNQMEETVRTWFKRAGFKVKSYCVHSQNESSEEELESFKNANNKNTIHLLFGVNALNEGVHFGSDINFTIFLRQTSSEIIYMQQLGRVLQAGEKGNPIVLDLVCNFKNINTKSFYDSFSNTIKKTNKLRKSLNLSNLKTTEEYLEGFVYDECIELQQVLENITTKLRTTWEDKFHELERMYLSHGKAYLKLISAKDKLYIWLNNQRRLRRDGLLAQYRIDLLDSIEFTWEPVEEFWELKYSELKEYYVEHNTTDIPQKYPLNPSLGKWVNNQRTLFKKGLLSKYKIDKLNELNFIWDIQENTWLNFVKKFKQFYKENQHGNVPQRYKKDPSLGYWVSNQRKLRRKGLLSEEKIKILESNGFIWDLSKA